MTLLEQLKSYLSVTYEDEETNKKLESILKRAGDTLSRYAGYNMQFSSEEESAEKQLLFDCCRYIYNDAFDAFKVNFAPELIALRAQNAVREDETTDEIQT